MRRLLWLYPKAWRERYGAEFLALFGHEPLSAGDVFDIVLNALLARWSQLGAITGQWADQVASWCSGRASTTARYIVLVGGIAVTALVLLLRMPSAYVVHPVAGGVTCTAETSVRRVRASQPPRCAETGQRRPVRPSAVVVPLSPQMQAPAPLTRSPEIVASTIVKPKCSPVRVARNGRVSAAAGMTQAQVRRQSGRFTAVISMCISRVSG